VRIKDLPKLAKLAGLKVIEQKYITYICRKHHQKPSIAVYEDGSILRADVRPELCQKMTLKDALVVLGLKPQEGVKAC
jgi:hypothetical protein